MAGKWLWAGVVAVMVAAAIYLLGRNARQAEPDEGPIASLVLFLREARPLTVEQVQQASERAFGGRFALDDPQADRAVIADQPGIFVVKAPTFTLGVISHAGPYMNDVAAAAEQQRVFLLKRAIQEHQAWLAVDWIDGKQEPSYGPIGKLLAELAGDHCLAIYCPEKGEMNSYGPDLPPLLRGPEPLAALRAPRPDPVVPIKEDDADVAAATQEAKARWPEFVAAFAKRKPRQGFAVKVPFQDAQGVEFMWVEVARLDGERIHGKLVNRPETVKHVQLNDAVTVALADLNDWIYSDGERMVGGFTAKALEARKKK